MAASVSNSKKNVTYSRTSIQAYKENTPPSSSIREANASVLQ
jgi:hypothetical protein